MSLLVGESVLPATAFFPHRGRTVGWNMSAADAWASAAVLFAPLGVRGHTHHEQPDSK
jgi:hypothetical protein